MGSLLINKNNIYIYICIFIITFSLNLHYIFGHWFFYLPIVFLVGFYVIFSIFYNKFNKFNKILLLLLSFVFIMILYSLIFTRNNISILYSILSIFLLCFGYWIAKQPEKNIVMYASLNALVLYYVFFVFSGLKQGFSADSINSYLVDASRNVVSTIALFMQLTYSMSYYNYYKKLPIITSFFTLLICILCFGRTGIFLSTLFFLFSFYGFMRNKIMFLCFIFIISCIIFIYWEYLANIIMSKTNFERGLESPRTNMQQEYIERLDWENIVVGVDLSTLPSLYGFGGNPHNSFIYGHSQFGIIYIVYLLIILLYVMKFSLCLKDRMIYIFFIMIYVVKAFTDKVALFDVGDFVLYFIFFSMYFNSRVSIKC